MFIFYGFKAQNPYQQVIQKFAPDGTLVYFDVPSVFSPRKSLYVIDERRILGVAQDTGLICLWANKKLSPIQYKHCKEDWYIKTNSKDIILIHDVMNGANLWYLHYERWSTNNHLLFGQEIRFEIRTFLTLKCIKRIPRDVLYIVCEYIATD